LIDLASALWNQRQELSKAKKRLMALHEAVNKPTDLNLGQWFQLYAFGLEFAPDMILDLGRGYGNSTCVFAEVANRVGNMKVVSIGYDAEQAWKTQTVQRLRGIVTSEWFDPLEILHQDILRTDFGDVFSRGKRVFLFWDAHGLELAGHMLAEVFPHLAAKDHVIAVHDITDARYHNVSPTYIREDGLPQTWMDHLVSPFEELTPLYDFLSRNQIAIDTPNNSLQKLLQDNEKRIELETCLERDFSSPTPLETGHWIYFELKNRNNPKQEIVFPRYSPGKVERVKHIVRSWTMTDSIQL